MTAWSLRLKPSRKEGAGKTGSPLAPAVLRAGGTEEGDARRHTGAAGTSRPSLRSGLTAYVVLSPGSDALLPPSPRGLVRHEGPDHTILPYAGCIGRVRAGDRSRDNPPCNALRANAARVHHVPPRVRDDRDTPSPSGRSERDIRQFRNSCAGACRARAASSLRGALATKQSRLSPRRDAGLFRCARNDDGVAIRDMALGFASEKIAPHALRWDEEKHFPVDVMREAASLGMGGIYIRDDVGGSAMTRFDAALIFEALATGCPTTSAFISIHNMASWMIDAYGNDT
ncbi:hypothetical protein E4T56_gene14396, partial [Termitomyces sp. T112]